MSQTETLTNLDVIKAKAEKLIPYLQEEGYENLRMLDDGTVVGTLDLMFTRAICIGLDEYSWERRFCFEDRELALTELAKLKTIDDDPVGFVANRIKF